jgi:hypothetical protein
MRDIRLANRHSRTGGQRTDRGAVDAPHLPAGRLRAGAIVTVTVQFTLKETAHSRVCQPGQNRPQFRAPPKVRCAVRKTRAIRKCTRSERCTPLKLPAGLPISMGIGSNPDIVGLLMRSAIPFVDGEIIDADDSPAADRQEHRFLGRTGPFGGL